MLHKKGTTATVEIKGLDIYDPVRDEVKARNVEDIAYRLYGFSSHPFEVKPGQKVAVRERVCLQRSGE